eukprot:gnl/MRDRNA2_/MRDRNA2_135212_c0_seq1.p1 gnl/MRDRNA2_/MRDRNA2_135212_c0~~gnl/MRDRNA2_/MRDRNA2_135212_c0_seq1.p1  ORF type:complete len:478 (+),score=84.99 gnl/MRDRNA2_/MRDRNA2_135212_c0_seq1:109-1542(+)
MGAQCGPQCNRMVLEGFEAVNSKCSGDGAKVVVDHNYECVDHNQGEIVQRAIPQNAVYGISVEDLDAPSASMDIAMPFSSKTGDEQKRHAGTELKIIQRAKQMTGDIRKEKDMLHVDWEGPCGVNPLEFMFDMTGPGLAWASVSEGDKQKKLGDAIKTLAKSAQRIISAEPTLLQASVPAKVFGDIHGQFRDMLLLLDDFGFPENSGTSFVFNGDWVDRGKHQLEVICLVFALKVAFPTTVFLVRGNHEDPMQGAHMGAAGFPAHCVARLGEAVGNEVWVAIATVFDWLPLACLLSDKILVLHGGIGDGDWDLSHLRGTTRPLSHDMLAADLILYNILWSDPVPDDNEESYGVHDSPRDNHANLVKSFGADVTAAFCDRNALEMVVRSHEARKDGSGYDVMHKERLMRVFSARDYESNRNDGAVLSISRKAEIGIGVADGGPWVAARLVVRPQVLKSFTKSVQDSGLGDKDLSSSKP